MNFSTVVTSHSKLYFDVLAPKQPKRQLFEGEKKGKKGTGARKGKKVSGE